MNTGCGGSDVIRRCEACLVQGKAGSSARIDEEQGLFERHIAERLDERHLEFAPRDRDLQFIAALIAELQKIFGADVRDQVAERAVQGDHFSASDLCRRVLRVSDRGGLIP